LPTERFGRSTVDELAVLSGRVAVLHLSGSA
jgi:hypothetical protein